MLRIDRDPQRSDGIGLRVEGQLVGEWVGLLEEQCLQDIAQVGAVGLTLYLEEITFVDVAGRRLLRGLKSAGVRLAQCPPLIEAILAEGPEYDDSARS